MSKFINLQGKVFGRLKVLARNGSKHQRPLWNCVCKCGKTVNVTANNLTVGKTKSCGCLKSEISKKSIVKLIGHNKLKKGEASFNNLYKNYQFTAKYKGLIFNITKDEFRKLSKEKCLYCARKPYHKYDNKNKTLNGSYLGNGLDRLNSKLGYTLSNVVTCCKICNIMKSTLTPRQFIEHLLIISNNVPKIKEALCLK